MVHPYAGLSKGQLNLVVFNEKEQLRQILERIKITVKDERLIQADGSQNHCHTCKENLTLDNLGHIMPGSTLMFCEDPICLAEYVVEHLPEELAVR